MKLDMNLVKLSVIVLAQRLVAIAKNNSQRLIIREWFTQGELPFLQWFKPSYLLSLTPKQVLGLGIIALFTLLTFPLGIWLGSFSMGRSYPVMNMIGASINLLSFPIALNLMVNVLGEMQLNRTTWMGIILIIISKLIIIAGCYLLYVGNQP